MSPIQSLLEAAVRTATPLLLAAVGEVVVERAGIINIGLEGLIIGGAFGALVGATHGGVAVGFLAAIGVGVSLALVFYLFVDPLGTDQIVTGTAITILALGGTAPFYPPLYGSPAPPLSFPPPPP